MSLTTQDIQSIKEALQPEFNKMWIELKSLEGRLEKKINLVGKRVDELEMKVGKRIDLLEERIEKRIELVEMRVEARIELSEHNIIETQGDLHKEHEIRITRLEKVIQIS